MEKSTILLVDDDPALLRLVTMSLRRKGYRVITADRGADALRLAYNEHPDLVILDVMMPRMDGWEVCQRLREMTDTPIIFLTSCDDLKDRLQGFTSGADDYITKPFNIEELLLRIAAILRRVEGPKLPPVLSFDDGHLEIDLEGHRVTLRGEEVSLTLKEFAVLLCLARRAGKIVPREQILREVWKESFSDSTTDYLKVYISRLRYKLEEDPENPRYILTQHGVGYRFQG
jgi:two-component system KDP operon response regulator KdpE